MIRNWKKMWPAATASLVATTSFLSAASEDAQKRNLENRISALEQKKNANGVINPNGRPSVKEGADIFVTVDALYWRANVNGIEYAVQYGNCACGDSDSGSSDSSDSSSGSGANCGGPTANFCNPKFKFTWGYRLGLGYNLPHDGWDIYLYWTRFKTNPQEGGSCHSQCQTSCQGDDSDDVIGDTTPSNQRVPLYVAPHEIADGSFIDNTTAVNPTQVTGRWKMRLNLLDLELGREFFTSKWLTLRPFAGVRAAWIKQELKTADFAFQTSSPGSLTAPAATFNKQKINYWGVGPRAGLNTNWGLGGGLSIYGNAAMSLVYSHFDDSFKQCVQVCGVSGTSDSDLNTKRKFFVARAIADLALGLRWRQSFCDEQYAVSLAIGWEEHFFFGQNQFLRFADSGDDNAFITNQGDLTLSGLTLGARFDF